MNIQDLYDEAYAKTRAAQQPLPVDTGENAYNALKEQTALNRAMMERNLKERMVNMPTTLQTNTAMAGLSDIGAVTRQQQEYAGLRDAMAQQAAMSGQAQLAGIRSDVMAGQFGAEMEQAENDRQRLYEMFRAKKLTAKQFQNLTGIDVRAYGGKRKPSGNPWADLNDSLDAGGRQNARVIQINALVDSGSITPEQAVDYYNRFVLK